MKITGWSVRQGSWTVVKTSPNSERTSGVTFSAASRVSSTELSSTRLSCAATSRAVTRPVPQTTAARKGRRRFAVSSRNTPKYEAR